jgi:translation elongation factor EF-Ts
MFHRTFEDDMSTITAATVNELRKKTDQPLMD